MTPWEFYQWHVDPAVQSDRDAQSAALLAKETDMGAGAGEFTPASTNANEIDLALKQAQGQGIADTPATPSKGNNQEDRSARQILAEEKSKLKADDGPWSKYKTEETGPWTKYAAAEKVPDNTSLYDKITNPFIDFSKKAGYKAADSAIESGRAIASNPRAAAAGVIPTAIQGIAQGAAQAWYAPQVALTDMTSEQANEKAAQFGRDSLAGMKKSMLLSRALKYQNEPEFSQGSSALGIPFQIGSQALQSGGVSEPTADLATGAAMTVGALKGLRKGKAAEPEPKPMDRKLESGKTVGQTIADSLINPEDKPATPEPTQPELDLGGEEQLSTPGEDPRTLSELMAGDYEFQQDDNRHPAVQRREAEAADLERQQQNRDQQPPLMASDMLSNDKEPFRKESSESLPHTEETTGDYTKFDKTRALNSTEVTNLLKHADALEEQGYPDAAKQARDRVKSLAMQVNKAAKAEGKTGRETFGKKQSGQGNMILDSLAGTIYDKVKNLGSKIQHFDRTRLQIWEQHLRDAANQIDDVTDSRVHDYLSTANKLEGEIARRDVDSQPGTTGTPDELWKSIHQSDTKVGDKVVYKGKLYKVNSSNSARNFNLESLDGKTVEFGVFSNELTKPKLSPLPNAGPGGKQGGAVDPSIFKRSPKEPENDPRESIWNESIKGMLDTSPNPGEFRLKMQHFSTDPDWQSNLAANADAIFKNKENILKDWNPTMPTENVARFVRPVLPVTRYLRDIVKSRLKDDGTIKALSSDDDVGAVRQSIWGSESVRELANKGIGGQILRAVQGHVENIVMESTRYMEPMKQHMHMFNILKKESRQKIMRVFMELDSMADTQNRLVNAGLQWASEDMLRNDYGLSPGEIKAYQGITKAVDLSYDLINMARSKMGESNIERIPGYFPHIWLGSFRVYLGTPGGEPEQVATIKTFSTRRAAENFVKSAQDEGWPLLDKEENGSFLVRPKITNTTLDFIEAFRTALEYNKGNRLDAALTARLAKLENRAMQGMFKHEMETSGKGGYLGSEGFQPKGLIFEPYENIRLENIYNSYIESVVNYVKDVSIRRDVLKPFDDAAREGLFGKSGLNAEHLVSGVRDYISRNVEKTHQWKIGQWLDVFDKHADRMMNDAIQKISFGKAPEVNFNVDMVMSRHLMDYIYYSQLYYTGKYGASNVLQPAHAIHNIARMGAYLRAENMKGMSAPKAWAEFGKYYLKGIIGHEDPYVAEGIKFLDRGGTIDVQNATHTDPRAGLTMETNDPAFRKVMQAWDRSQGVFKPFAFVGALTKAAYETLEEHNRQAVAAASIGYLKGVFPDDPIKAYTAAAHMMNTTMGNYTKGHSAAVYQHLGILGRTTKPFSTLRQTYYGDFISSLNVIKETAQKSNWEPGQILQALQPLIYMQLVYGAMAGVSGIIMYPEVRWLWEFFRKQFPGSDMPQWDYMVRGLYQHLPPSMQWGLVSNAIGHDVSASMAAPNYTEQNPIMPPMTGPADDIAKLAIANLKDLLFSVGLSDTPAPERDFAEAARHLAPNTIVTRPLVEAGKKLGGPVGKMLQMTSRTGVDEYYAAHPGLVPKGNLEGEYNRTPEETLGYELSGGKSLKEVTERRANYVRDEEEARNTNYFKSGVEAIVDAQMGKSSENPGEIAKRLLESGRGMDADLLSKAIQEEMIKRSYPELDRTLQRIGTQRAPARQNNLDILRQMGVVK